ncbi:phage major capsid protein [Arthrobacter sp. NPDC080073]|uniref:phage major capsid protein n=1 Tax=Arthrobacter sp. NPDC080073 TaxID=3155919 RepID=UPI0034440384
MTSKLPTYRTSAQARDALKSYAAAALQILNNTSLDNATAKRLVEPLEEQLNHAESELKSLEYVEGKSRAFSGAAGTDPTATIFGPSGYVGHDTIAKRGYVPNLIPDREQMQQIIAAVKSGTSLRVELGMKIPSSADAMQANEALLPPTLLPGIVNLRFEPTRILERMPSTPMGPSVEWISHLSTTGAATTVAPGALKPEVSLNMGKTIITPAKIAVTSTLNDEVLLDFRSIESYVTEHLRDLVIDAENNQLLNGDGTGTNMLGMLNQSGILTRAVGTDTGLDAMEQAIADLRVGPAYCDADTVILHPTTWSKLRRTKDSQGRYILNPDPTAAEANSLWGIPVVTTTKIAAGASVVANLQVSCTALIREGINLQVGKPGDTFQRNQTAFIQEERLNLGVQRPAGIVKVTGL